MAREVVERAAWVRGGPGVPMTYDEWLDAQDEDSYSEWVDGEGFWYMPASDRHQAVKGFLYVLLWLFCERFGSGVVRDAPLEMRLDTSAREPDILFLRDEHLPRLTPMRLLGPADLVVELISTDTVRRDQIAKRREYEVAGVPEYWILDPRPGKERSEFFALNSAGAYEPIRPDATGRIRSRVLPGFVLDPAWLWQDPFPPVLDLLATMAADSP